jgi:hypothetical protein
VSAKPTQRFLLVSVLVPDKVWELLDPWWCPGIELLVVLLKYCVIAHPLSKLPVS